METIKGSGAAFRELLRGGAARLRQDKNEINDLNVFPIPDGDTGDNMYMTIRAGAEAVKETESLYRAAAEAAKGMLLGARGNSGVILSRIFAGIAEGLSGREEADTEGVLQALRCGVKEAYAAVSVPVEGTMLTVYREAIEKAIANWTEEMSLLQGLRMLRAEAERSLERTPELLAVLREAGVVDSGGAGLVSILRGMESVAAGEQPAAVGETGSGNAPDLDLFTEDSVLEYGYCTEFLLRLQRCKPGFENFSIDEFRAELEKLGESVVAFRDGTAVKVHIHTKTPSEVLAFAQRFGEFLTVKIENMTIQHHEKEEHKTKKAKAPHKKYAVVAVAPGKGIGELFTDMGADAVLSGGRSKNPSAADFVDAFEAVNADTVFVLPGDSNIILTAKQAGEIFGRSEVRVMPCRTTGAILAALAAFDPSLGDSAAMEAEICRAVEAAKCGSVSHASRSAEKDGWSVKKADWIGYSEDTILADAPEREAALYLLCERLEAEKYPVLMLLCGADVPEEESRRVYKTLAARFPRTEIIMQNGGQSVQDYILLLQ